MDIKKRAEKQKNWIEKGLHMIPGFKGYYERELRRDSDKLQRDFIVLKLNEGLTVFREMIKDVTRKSDLKQLTEYGDIQKYFEKVINNIKYSDRGYTGFFDLIKVKEKELDVIYEKDLEIVEAVLEFNESLSLVKEIASDSDKLKKVRKSLEDIEESYEKRNKILKGFEGG
ncbi:MAG: hypothetical protein ABFR36_02710 [Acidobacteriota bacterium]